jgi:hypothetical protein
MIWLLFALCLFVVVALAGFVIPSKRPMSPRRNPNQPCPACGHTSGKLRCIADPSNRGKVLMQHICSICGARWAEKPVLSDAQPDLIQPAVKEA